MTATYLSYPRRRVLLSSRDIGITALSFDPAKISDTRVSFTKPWRWNRAEAYSLRPVLPLIDPVGRQHVPRDLARVRGRKYR